MAKYFKTFLGNNDGIETIEFIGLIIVAAVLIGAVAGIAGTQITSMTNNQEVANNATNKALEDLGQTGGVSLEGLN